jgi:hypothetical protein
MLNDKDSQVTPGGTGVHEGSVTVDPDTPNALNPEDALRKTLHEEVDKANLSTLKRMQDALSREEKKEDPAAAAEKAAHARMDRLGGTGRLDVMSKLRASNPEFVKAEEAKADTTPNVR